MKALIQLTLTLLMMMASSAWAILPPNKNLPITLAPSEKPVAIDAYQKRSTPPVGPIQSLGEWEESDAVMTLWVNPSLVKELSQRGQVFLFGDSDRDIQWWKQWVNKNKGIKSASVKYLKQPTNSIWVRDYGPWFIIDGNSDFAMVDQTYNRPRPQDDVIPQYLSQRFNIPIYQLGLVHTGGNYYSDSDERAFSSTLVYTENSKLSKSEVNSEMEKFLGIKTYTTSPLGVRVTIEHLDTFGKLVAPDTWVFGQFPKNSRFYKDAENMVAKLKKMKSVYGTAYKIYRLPMMKRPGGFGREDYRAYINSFISNKTLYFSAYGDDKDMIAKEVYEKALPGYDIVGVDALRTEWGDSVHCRTRNFHKKNTLFIFPKVTHIPVDSSSHPILTARIIPSPGHQLTDVPMVHLSVNGRQPLKVSMTEIESGKFQAQLPKGLKGDKYSLYIEVKDSSGIVKTAPFVAPQMAMDFEIGESM